MVANKNIRRSRKTGKVHTLNRKRSMIARKAARKRKGKHLSAAVRRKIKMGEARVRKTGRTKTGLKSRLKRH